LGEYVSFLDETGLDDLRQVGGKAANLGHLTGAGYRVPAGFSVKADAFDLLLSASGLRGEVKRSLDSLDFDDLPAVDAEMDHVRSLIESTPVQPAVETEIREAYAKLTSEDPGALVAVRSSVGTRDLSASSFPGQMDTYHNVKGADDVLDLVRRCWASCFSYRATVSRNARGIDHFDVFIAPLVQLMVPAETAGVLFSANPLNGEPGQCVINACFGLGEGVVSGEVNADHLVIDRSSGRTLEAAIGEKRFMFTLDPGSGAGTRKVELAGERGASPCLGDSQVRELTELAGSIEQLYGCPQDIEWAYRDGVLHVLQSRKITALGSASAPEAEWDSEFDTRVDPRYPYYTLSNISEVLCGVLTPLTISGIDALDYGFVKTNTDFGLLRDIKPDSEHTFLGIFYNRAHLNLSVVKAVTTKLPGASAQEFERMVPDDASEFDEKFVLTPRSAATMAGAMLRVLYKVIHIGRDVRAMRADLSARINTARALDVERMPYDDLFAWMDESREYRFKVIAHHITVSQFAVVFHDLMRKLTEKWLDDEHGTIAARLVTGLQNIESAQPSIEIWDLSRLVKRSPALLELFAGTAPEELLDAVTDSTDPDCAAFHRELEAFLARFGYRSVFEAELMLPNWGDDPSYVFTMIANYLQTDETVSPRELAGKQEAERIETSRQVMARLGGPQRPVFSLFLWLSQKFIAMREYTKATLVMGIAQIKREYHALSRRFTAEGIIDEPLDVFFLTSDEVRALAVGRRIGEDPRAVISRRRAEYERNKTVVLPEYSKGKPVPLRPEDLAAGGGIEVLSGIAVSPGRVTGRARVITDPRSNARIQPGEILVAPVTDAAWTPLFVTAGAIVVDVGGPLSHGSIVAREYGIPGVLNVGTATRIVKTGQLITVDGDAGKVFLHADETAETT
jgi:rifampicin phosphotransferase